MKNDIFGNAICTAMLPVGTAVSAGDICRVGYGNWNASSVTVAVALTDASASGLAVCELSLNRVYKVWVVPTDSAGVATTVHVGGILNLAGSGASGYTIDADATAVQVTGGLRCLQYLGVWTGSQNAPIATALTASAYGAVRIVTYAV